MITRAALHTMLLVDDAELQDWIDRLWVRPAERNGAMVFEEIDIARLRLIHTLRHDLAIDADSLPVILSLLDQLHETRRVLAALQATLRDRRPD